MFSFLESFMNDYFLAVQYVGKQLRHSFFRKTNILAVDFSG